MRNNVFILFNRHYKLHLNIHEGNTACMTAGLNKVVVIQLEYIFMYTHYQNYLGNFLRITDILETYSVTSLI